MKTITLNESLEYTYEINEENQYLKINYIRLFLKKDSLKEDFFYSGIFGMTLKEIVKKIIQPLMRCKPGIFSMVDYELVRKALKVEKL